MHVESFRVQNLRSFADSGTIELGRINLFTGNNNAGKSTLVRSLHGLQGGTVMPTQGDDRIGSEGAARIEYRLVDPALETFGMEADRFPELPTVLDLWVRGGQQPPKMGVASPEGYAGVVAQAGNMEPHNFIYPYFSNRKQQNYQQNSLGSQRSRDVSPTLQNLASKVNRLGATHPSYRFYADACTDLLGFIPSIVELESTQTVGRWVETPTGAGSIPIESMGDGVPMILGLVTALAGAKGKLFLIEEPESDLHPSALKALLELISISAETNQFVISTHSNVVLTYLGSDPETRVFTVTLDQTAEVPTSTVAPVEGTPEARSQVLADLGYALSDSALYEGWLILEEATAESFINEVLIPRFAPRLTRVRTVSAGGVDRVEPMTDDFVRLFLFCHLEKQYQGRAWVVVDGDKPGLKARDRLQAKYKGWPADHFTALTRDDIERYYPEMFTDQVETTLAAPNGPTGETAKGKLFQAVRHWAESEDDDVVVAALEATAGELIDVLRRIEAAIV